jgi:hypothetical protein
MKKQAVGVLLGGLTLFLWGMVSWMVIPWHDSTMKYLPQEQLITDTLKTVVHDRGVYFFPSDKTAEGHRNQTEWSERYRRGPVGFLVFSPQGMEPMGASTFLFAIITDLIISFLVLYFLSLCRERVATVKTRVKVTSLLGALVGVVAHVSYWNWFHFPVDYTMIAVVDTIVSFALLGLVISKFVTE